jgi:hypothetical protein
MPRGLCLVDSSMHWCRKGCDFAKGRANDTLLRKQVYKIKVINILLLFESR